MSRQCKANHHHRNACPRFRARVLMVTKGVHRLNSSEHPACKLDPKLQKSGIPSLSATVHANAKHTTTCSEENGEPSIFWNLSSMSKAADRPGNAFIVHSHGCEAGPNPNPKQHLSTCIHFHVWCGNTDRYIHVHSI